MKRLIAGLLVGLLVLPAFALKTVNSKRVPEAKDWSAFGTAPKYQALDSLLTCLANVLPSETKNGTGLEPDSLRGDVDIDSINGVDLMLYSESDKGSIGSVMKTLKVTIGHPGETTTDTAFASAANTTEQTLKLPAQVPAYARIVDVLLRCTESVAGTGISEFACDIGDGAGTAEYGASASVNAANEIISSPINNVFYVATSGSAVDIYVNGTPTGGNWSAMTGGEWTVYITYIDNASM